MQKRNFKIFILLILAITMLFSACSKEPVNTEPQKSSGQIYLYGEIHGSQPVYEKELELWTSYYEEQGMRHLFVELPYYTAEFLNIWMTAEDDTILNELYQDWYGTAMHVEATLDFYKAIKQECPETIFHGTDVGHQYTSTGQRYLAYLRNNDMAESPQYTLAEECIEQGKRFYEGNGDKYREIAMVANFIREFDALEDVDVMGIYGAAHTNPNADTFGVDGLPCMAKQLFERYGENLFSEDISSLAKDIPPLSYETITLNGKSYEAAFYGKVDISAFFPEYQYREFWLIENAYEDFKDYPTNGNVLPYDNYPMAVEVGQIYLIQYTLTDDSIKKEIHRANGSTWQNFVITEEIIVE